MTERYYIAYEKDTGIELGAGDDKEFLYHLFGEDIIIKKDDKMTERFMIDDCGTLIDMETRNTYDYVSEVLGLLNELNNENEELKQDKKRLIGYLHRYGKVDVEDIDDVILNKEYFDEWGNLYD